MNPYFETLYILLPSNISIFFFFFYFMSFSDSTITLVPDKTTGLFQVRAPTILKNRRRGFGDEKDDDDLNEKRERYEYATQALGHSWRLMATSCPGWLDDDEFEHSLTATYTRVTPPGAPYSVILESVRRNMERRNSGRLEPKGEGTKRSDKAGVKRRKQPWRRPLHRWFHRLLAGNDHLRWAKFLRAWATPMWEVLGIGVIEELGLMVLATWRGKTLLSPRDLSIYCVDIPNNPYKVMAEVAWELRQLKVAALSREVDRLQAV
ncbi:hypothetical protein BJ166DRAFT_597367 [Pestalotiopsis sp. NC0098]|nr:hypothetical protein BJ166DRAFT_597367 [Pestalotiopsis sp. NC0098]